MTNSKNRDPARAALAQSVALTSELLIPAREAGAQARTRRRAARLAA